jgi:hypothetical protein
MLAPASLRGLADELERLRLGLERERMGWEDERSRMMMSLEVSGDHA